MPGKTGVRGCPRRFCFFFRKKEGSHSRRNDASFQEGNFFFLPQMPLPGRSPTFWQKKKVHISAGMTLPLGRKFFFAPKWHFRRKENLLFCTKSQQKCARPPTPCPASHWRFRNPDRLKHTGAGKGVFGVSPSGCLRTALMRVLCRGINGVLFREMGVLFEDVTSFCK